MHQNQKLCIQRETTKNVHVAILKEHKAKLRKQFKDRRKIYKNKSSRKKEGDWKIINKFIGTIPSNKKGRIKKNTKNPKNVQLF